MATVPILQQQVAPEALPGVRQSFDLPDSSGIGQAARGLGGSLAGIVDKIDGAAVDNAQIEATRRINDLQAEAYKQQGINANGLPQKFQADGEKIRSELTQNLNPRQQEMFNKAFAPTFNGALFSVQRHAQAQVDAAAIDAAAGLAATKAASWAVTQNPQEWDEMLAAANKVADLKGMQKETRDLFVQKQKWEANAAAVAYLSTHVGPEAAAAHLEAHKEDMDPSTHSNLLAKARQDSDVMFAQIKSDDLINVNTVAGVTDFGKAIAQAKADVSLLGAKRDAVIARLNEAERQYREDRAAADQAGMIRYDEDRMAGKVPAKITPAQFRQTYGDMAFRQYVDSQIKEQTRTVNVSKAADMQSPLWDQVNHYPLNGTKVEQQAAMQKFYTDLGELERTDPKSAEGFRTAFLDKVRSVGKLDEAMLKTLHADKIGLLAQITKMVGKANRTWYGGNIIDATQAGAIGLSVYREMVAAAKAHAGEWGPEELVAYFDKHPTVKLLREGKSMDQIQSRFVTGPAAEFQSDALKPKPIVIQFPSAAATAVSNVLAKSVTQK